MNFITDSTHRCLLSLDLLEYFKINVKVINTIANTCQRDSKMERRGGIIKMQSNLTLIFLILNYRKIPNEILYAIAV